MRVKRPVFTPPRQFFFEYPNIKYADFVVFQSQDPTPCATKQKDYLHPSLVFATININRTQNIPRNPEGKKQNHRPLKLGQP